MARGFKNWSWSKLGWATALVLAACHAWMLNRYSVNFPSADDFTQLLAVPGYVANSPTFADKVTYLFSLSVDHRIATLRAIAYVQATLLGGLDFRALIFVGNALCAAAGLVVLARAPAESRGWLAPLFAMLLFSPTNWIAQYWPTGAVQHLALLAYALLALLCLDKPGIGRTASALLLTLCAVFTAANGLMLFPAAAAQFWMSGRRKVALLWLGGGVVLGLLYFHGYATPGGRASAQAALLQPVQLCAWFLTTLGSMAAQAGPTNASAMLLGGVLIATWAWLLISARQFPVPRLLLAWALFLVLSIAAITIGRAPLGVEALVNSRYRVYSEFATLVTVVSVVYRLRAYNLGGERVLATLLLPLAAVWSWAMWEANLGVLVDFSLEQRNARDHYMVTRGRGMYRDFPPQDFGDFLLTRARDSQHLPPFPVTPVAVATFAADMPPLKTLARFLDAAPPFAHAGALSIHGQVPSALSPVAVWLRRDDLYYKGTPQHERVVYPDLANRRVAFWNTWSLVGLAPGQYEVGYARGDLSDSQVYWTGASIDVD